MIWRFLVLEDEKMDRSAVTVQGLPSMTISRQNGPCLHGFPRVWH